MNTNVSDEEIEAAFQNTNFGEDTPAFRRRLLEQGCLKRLVPYHSGWTLTCILVQLGLMTKKGNLTSKGRKFMYAAFQQEKHSG